MRWCKERWRGSQLQKGMSLLEINGWTRRCCDHKLPQTLSRPSADKDDVDRSGGEPPTHCDDCQWLSWSRVRVEEDWEKDCQKARAKPPIGCKNTRNWRVNFSPQFRRSTSPQSADLEGNPGLKGQGKRRNKRPRL